MLPSVRENGAKYLKGLEAKIVYVSSSQNRLPPGFRLGFLLILVGEYYFSASFPFSGTGLYRISFLEIFC